MIIREALKSELPAIRELRINAYREHAQKIPEDHWKVLKQSISSDADIQSGADCFVAEIDGKIVGSVALFPPKTDAYKGLVDELDHPEIRMLCVSEKARGKGVASKLIAECIQRAEAKGFRQSDCTRQILWKVRSNYMNVSVLIVCLSMILNHQMMGLS